MKNEEYILAICRDIKYWYNIQRTVRDESKIRNVTMVCQHNNFTYKFNLDLPEDQKAYTGFEGLLFGRLRKAILES